MDIGAETITAQAMLVLDNEGCKAACQFLEPFIKSGNAQAQWLASCMKLPDETDEEFDKRRLGLLRMAAGQGHANANYELGRMYDLGEELPLDKKRAVTLFEIAAAGGHINATYICATGRLYGANGVKRDIKRGKALLQQAVLGGSDSAYMLMAEFHETGAFGYEKSEALANDCKAKAERILESVLVSS